VHGQEKGKGGDYWKERTGGIRLEKGIGKEA